VPGPDKTPVSTVAARLTGVALASFALGALTSLAQGVLPEQAVPIANSASGWTLLTVLLIVVTRLGTAPAAVGGAVSFVLLVLGYTAASELRDLYYDPMLFGVIGVVVGPFVGVAASWLHRRDLPAALGTALLAGIGVGEAVYGLTAVAATTSPAYWIFIGTVALGLLAAMLARRIRGTLPILVALAGTAAVAGTFTVAYAAVGRP